MSYSTQPKASKKDLKEVRQYLDNTDASKIEAVYGVGQYKPWHGDGKSQSQTNITFQTKSQKTSGRPPQYVTIVARKGKKDAYVTYTSHTWDSADKIIKAMLDALAGGVRVSGTESTVDKDQGLASRTENTVDEDRGLASRTENSMDQDQGLDSRSENTVDQDGGLDNRTESTVDKHQVLDIKVSNVGPC